ncbi:MAG: phosphoribosylaminoimidazolesuccinocarboxamide synthase [Bacteroidota bacterium]|nr:phosphoribosylaminoimidazolesuccinocarboxamide synthase [Candidatus Kapabacteria bacterium]MCS7303398.1 phosphoribosylaminoimidazolesuccinocarboxamide synthase [Candidatus Kapabacteria bacterium]MCX7937416.1 phosphoribosylaminoimidazolesuccinocarboxamide synthase [Chlorobiota bacterium]MDW8075656.1 phosphoribosylaminoimidazolesuccinocarboxamide synthase [Bacteroidota bacterium]MDW8272287.1 phosphoribosylaminoimidazolesuccinocarboxamide synthase [Bacteroidota bacterium]
METVTPVLRIDLPLPVVHRGKVRDVFAVGDDALLIVATDRISAYDVVMDDPIPGKGIVLTELSVFWFERTRHIVPNHLLSATVEEFPSDVQPWRELLAGRSMLVRRTEPIRFECVVRGYLAGSAWREYQHSGTVAGIPLPAGMRIAEQLPQPLFTPATKAEHGHDENITFEDLCNRIGIELAAFLRDRSIALYKFAHTYALERGLIVADTKFEFGVLPDGTVLLIDEVLTPDSSRFWLAETYQPGVPPHDFDKQVLRDWLDAQEWNRTYPPPRLSPEIIAQTAERYRQALVRLTA